MKPEENKPSILTVASLNSECTVLTVEALSSLHASRAIEIIRDNKSLIAELESNFFERALEAPPFNLGLPSPDEIPVGANVGLHIFPQKGSDILYLRVIEKDENKPTFGVVYLFIDIVANSEITVKSITIFASFSNPFKPLANIGLPVSTTFTGRKRFQFKEADTIVFRESLPSFPEISISIDYTDAEGLKNISRKHRAIPQTSAYGLPFDFAALGWLPQYEDNLYVQLQAGHAGKEGGQVFAQDINVLKYDEMLGLVKVKPGSEENADYYLYARRIKSMCNGVVVYAYDENIDNPWANGRRIERVDEKNGTIFIQEIACATYGNRALYAAIDFKYNIVISFAQITAAAKISLFQEYPTSVFALSNLRIVVMTGPSPFTQSYFITSSQAGAAKASLVLWSVNTLGVPSVADQVSLVGAVDTKLTKLSSSRVLITIKVKNGDKYDLWLLIVRLNAGKFQTIPSYSGLACADVGEAFDAISVTDTSYFVTAVQRKSGRLRMNVWLLQDGFLGPNNELLNNVVKTGEREGVLPLVKEVSCVLTAEASVIGTAVRQQNDKLQFISWQVDKDGNIFERASLNGGPSSAKFINSGPFKRKSMIVTSVDENFKLRLTMFEQGLPEKENDPPNLEYITLRIANERNSPTPAKTEYPEEIDGVYGVAHFPFAQDVFVTVVQIQGFARVLTWQLPGNNAMRILNTSTNEIVSYLHLKRNSIEVPVGKPVDLGDPICAAGNSGSASGPTLHVQVDHVDDKALLVKTNNEYSALVSPRAHPS
jgi:hypothetical protein